MPLSRDYGETAIPWSKILLNYDEMVAANPAFTDISELAHPLAASEFVSAAGRDERHVLDGFSAGFRAVYSAWWVEAEVNNGGFNQYFWNSSGEFARDAVAGFDLIGVPAMARRVARAIAIRDQDEAKTRKFEQRGSLEAFSESYDGNRLNDLDREFGELEAEVSKARIRFIRADSDLFRGRCEAG